MENERVSRELLKEMRASLFGERKKATPLFSTGRRLDVVASFAAGHRVDPPTVYIAMIYPGHRDFVSKPATDAQIAQYPEAFAEYEEKIRRGIQEPYTQGSSGEVVPDRPADSGVDCRPTGIGDGTPFRSIGKAKTG